MLFRCVISYMMRDPEGAMVALRPLRLCQLSGYDRCSSAGSRRMYQGYQGRLPAIETIAGKDIAANKGT